METHGYNERTDKTLKSIVDSTPEIRGISIFECDLPHGLVLDLILRAEKEFFFIGIDTETTGWEYRDSKLALIQISVDDQVYFIRFPNFCAPNFQSLMQCKNIAKIFHFAYFDIKFIKGQMGIEIAGEIVCTKILMKIIYPGESNGLRTSLRTQLGIHIEKHDDDRDEFHAHWDADTLSKDQIFYGMKDCIYLERLT